MAQHPQAEQVVDADEVRDADRARPREHPHRSAVRHDAAALQHHAVVGQGQQLTDLVRHEQHRDAEIALDLEQKRQHVPGQLGVEGAGRLVEQEQLGIGEQRPPQGDALLFSARQVADAPLQQRRESQHLEDPAAAVASDPLGGAGRIRQVRPHAAVREQQRVLQHERDAASLGRQEDSAGAQAERALSGADACLLGLQESGHRMQQGRLAARGGAEDTEHLALARELDVEREAAEAMTDVRLEDHGGPGYSASLRRCRAESQKEPSRAARASAALTATRRITAGSPPRTFRSV